MTTYTAYLPPADTQNNPEESFVLIPDAKATLALFFPPFWLAWHKLWLPLMVYFVVIVAIVLLAIWSPSIAVSYLSILPGVYLLLEGYQLVRKDLEDKGWQYAGVVEGENRDEAEIRFVINSGDELIKSKPVIHSVIRNGNRPVAIGAGSNKNNMGLFPE